MKFMKKAKSMLLAGLASVGFMATSVANAALTQATHVDPVVAEVSADAGIVFTAFIIVIGTVLAMGVSITLLKRFGNKV